MNISKITILGGTSGFGKRLLEQILYLKDYYKQSFNIVITGTNIEKGKKVAQKYGVIFSNNNIEAVKNADIVIISVPIGKTEEIINQIGPYLKKGSILADVTSIKQKPFQAMNKFSDKVIVIPTHPMFGPFVKNIAGQIIILTPSDKIRKNKYYIWLKNFLKDQGAKVFELTPSEHDKIMSIIQGLTHFSLFVLADVIKKVSKQFKNKDILYFLDNFSSPVYKMLISLIGRYMSQNPYLYGEIQINNKENENIQKLFIQSALNFNNILFKDNNLDFFVEILQKNKKFFGDYAKLGQIYTDKIIFLLANQVEKFKNSIGKKIKIQNIYTKQIKEGILQKFDLEKEEIILDNEIYNINEWNFI